jgi:peptidoglycan hydrolase-like protein with peptidoglycan-binding domain
LTFTTDLKYNQRGDDVRYLQIFLKAQGPEIYPEGIVSGWFGPQTKDAVIRFQEKYASNILAPWGLINGTGFVGKTTRDKINEILGR